MNSDTTTPKNVVMVTVAASMFGGYKRTTESDITSAGGKLPETDILTKGGKHIFPTEKLSTFGTIKKDVFRQLWKFGVKSFGSGSVIAICEDDLEAAEQLLDKAQADFNAAIDELRRNYDTWLNEYIDMQPNAAAADIIRRSALTMEDACSRFSFSFDTFMPTPVGKHGSVESMASKLTAQLYTEVAQAAADAYDKTFYPADSLGVRSVRVVGQRAKSPLKACHDKLVKLSFLNPNVVGAVTIIESVLAMTQVTGYIEDTPSNPAAKRLLGLVKLMKDADNFAAAAEKIVASSTVDEDIDVLCGIASLWQPAAENDFDYVAAETVTGATVAQAIESISVNADEVHAATVTTSKPEVTIVPQPATPAVTVAQAYNPEEMFF